MHSRPLRKVQRSAWPEAEADALVFAQGLRPQRLAMLTEVGRRRAEHVLQDQQRAGDQAGVRNPVATAQGQVDAFGDQVLAAVLQEQFQAQVRITLEKSRNGRGQAGEGEGQRGVDPQQAAGALLHRSERGVGGLEIVEDALQALPVDFAGLGQAHVAGGAIDQAHLEVRFQLGDVLAHGGRREIHLPGRGGEAAIRGHGAEDLEGGEVIHGDNSLSVINESGIKALSTRGVLAKVSP